MSPTRLEGMETINGAQERIGNFLSPTRLEGMETVKAQGDGSQIVGSLRPALRGWKRLFVLACWASSPSPTRLEGMETPLGG